MTAGATVEADKEPRPLFPRIPCLDGIRGLSITVVVVHHVFMATLSPNPGRLDYIVGQLAFAALLILDLFFVLSGYLITTILDRTRDADARLKTFYARRFLRIFPAYYGFLIVAHFFQQKLGPDLAGTVTHLWDWFYLSNISGVIHTAPERGLAYIHFWSLSLEEHFYLVWPFVVYHTSRKTLMRICKAIFCVSLLAFLALTFTGHLTAAFFLTPTHAFTLAGGAYVAILQVENPGALDLWSRRVLKMAALWVPVAAIMLAARIHAQYTLQALIVAFFMFPALIGFLVLGHGGRFREFLHARVLVALGKYSYAMYIVHMAIMRVFLRAFGDPSDTIGGYRFPYQVVMSAIIFGLCFVVAFMSWHLIEKQFLKLSPSYRRSRPKVLDARLAPA